MLHISLSSSRKLLTHCFILMMILGICLGQSLYDSYQVSEDSSIEVASEKYQLYARKRSRKKVKTDPEEALAKALIKKAIEAHKVNRLELAISYFEKAYILVPQHKRYHNIHGNLAGLYQRVNKLDKALASINRYLEGEIPASKRTIAEEKRKEILKSMREQYLNPKTVVKPVQPYNSQTRTTVKPSSSPNKTPEKQTQVSNTDPMPMSTTTENASENRSWIIWGASGLALISVSIGLHLYADSTWQSRPMGGGAKVESIQSQVRTTSWIADGLLITGIVTLGVAIYKYIKRSQAYPTTSIQSSNHLRNKNDRVLSRKPMDLTDHATVYIDSPPTFMNSFPVFIW